MKSKKTEQITEDQNLLYIKLGQGGEWEKDCIEVEGTIRLGFIEADHEVCLSGDWGSISQYYKNVEKKTASMATQFANQIKKFYEEPESTIWFTFFGGYLWWCRSYAKVERLPDDGSKVRQVIGKWSNHDIAGNVISLSDLSGKLLQTRGFRGTICTPDAVNYLRRRINGQKMPEVVRSINAKNELVESMIPVIQSLSWQDFELLIDLIFRQGGWQREGVVGGTEKDIDLSLYSPVTKERIAIQVKSQSSIKEFENYLDRFADMSDFTKIFYAVHSGGEELASKQSATKVTVLSGKELGDLVVRTGLIDWVIKKAG